jgi:hypothetical protein
MSTNPTPHFEKLTAALQNEKLPARDKPRIEATIERYHAWLKKLDEAYKEGDSSKVLAKLVALLNEYKLHVDVELIFDSEDDFLYRQKGQFKLDMEQNIFHRQANLVKVTRLQKGPGDIGPREQFVGYLVDEAGHNIETPEIGTPIYLSGDETDLPWLFASDPIFRLEVYPTHWVALTEQGNIYEITNERIVQ